MAALPPNFKGGSDEEDAKVDADLADAARSLATGFAVFLALTAVCAYVAMLCWNSLTDLTLLAEIDWKQAFSALILVRVIGLSFHN